MSKKDKYPAHIRCVEPDEVLARTNGKCSCRAKDCPCNGCTGARKARGHEKKAEQAA